MEITHSAHSLRDSTSVPYIHFTPTNLSTLNLPSFKSSAFSTPIRGSERSSLRVALPTKRTQSCTHGIKNLISVTL